jgi:hypothetical protein
MDERARLEERIDLVMDLVEVSRALNLRDLMEKDDELIALQLEYKQRYGQFYYPLSIGIDDARAEALRDIISISKPKS